MMKIALRRNQAAVVFFTGIFLNYGQTGSSSNKVQNMIFNFSQVRYYPNCPYDSSNIIYQQPNYPPFYNNNIIYQ
jgi:hypothetical protein